MKKIKNVAKSGFSIFGARISYLRPSAFARNQKRVASGEIGRR